MRRKPSHMPTGRLQSLRLFSTLLYGPPPNCKRNRRGRETVCENVSGLYWRMVSGRMMMIRACLSLIIAAVVKDLISTQVLQAHRLTVFSSFLFFCRLLRSESQSHACLQHFVSGLPVILSVGLAALSLGGRGELR
jgi:hypothetical protein